MIGRPWLVGALGMVGVLVGVVLLVVLASRRARDRRAQRKRIAARRVAYRQGSAPPWGWRGQWPGPGRAATIPPPATSVPPLPPPPPSGRVYGTPARDRDETSVIPRFPWGGEPRG